MSKRFLSLNANETMNTKYQVEDWRVTPFNWSMRDPISFIVDNQGHMSCGHAGTFNALVGDYKNLTNHEKEALKFFKYQMDRKYGYGQHEYRIRNNNR